MYCLTTDIRVLSPSIRVGVGWEKVTLISLDLTTGTMVEAGMTMIPEKVVTRDEENGAEAF